ncbi:MAG: DUF5132 domain-containing protein [Chloroflexota bacterium]
MGELFEALLGGAGWGVGLGVVLGAASLAGKGLRPLAKEAVKVGMTATTRVQEWTAEMREQMDDIVAEARADQETPATPSSDTLVTPAGEPATPPPAKRRRAET